MDNITIRTVSKLLIPFIQLFSLYVIVHGDSGPGGGFQGGVILGASFIIYSLIFGAEQGRIRISRKTSDILSSVGVMIYASVGVLCLFFGGLFLEYNVLPLGSAHAASHYGIFFIEVGVGITVSAVMVAIFFETADRGPTRKVAPPMSRVLTDSERNDG